MKSLQRLIPLVILGIISPSDAYFKGNVVRIHVDQAQVNLADTIGVWGDTPSVFGPVLRNQSEYIQAVNLDDKYYLLKRTFCKDETYGYFGSSFDLEFDDIQTGKTYRYGGYSDEWRFGLIDLAVPLPEENGFWLFSQGEFTAFLTTDGTYTGYMNGNDFPLHLRHICGKLEDGYCVVTSDNEGSGLFEVYIADLSDSPNIELKRRIAQSWGVPSPITYINEILSNIYLIGSNSNVGGGLHLCTMLDDSLIQLKEYGIQVSSYGDERIQLFEDTLLIVTNGALLKSYFNEADSSFSKPDTLLSDNYDVDYYFNYGVILKNKTIYLYKIRPELQLIKSWDVSQLDSPQKPLVDYPYIYIHQKTQVIDGISEDQPIIVNRVDVSANPNPANATMIFKYDLDRKEKVRIEIFDNIGRQVDLIETNGLPGINSYAYTPLHLATGIYFARFKTGNNLKTLKIVFIK